MACLERSPEWRPRDLAYVAQLAQHAAMQRGGTARASRPAAKTATPAAERARKPAKAPARSTLEPRGGEGDGRSPRLLLIVAGLLATVAAGGYFWMTRGSATERAAAPRPIVPTPVAAGAPTTEPSATPRAPRTGHRPCCGAHRGADAHAVGNPDPGSDAHASACGGQCSRGAQCSRGGDADAAAGARTGGCRASPRGRARDQRAGRRHAARRGGDAVAPAAPPVRERAELSTLSPLSVKRPGRVLFDLRGTALAADLQARLVAVREAPRGLSVVRQKCSGTLCNVLVELDDSVKPSTYAIVLEDPEGRQTNALTFTVTR